MAVQSAVACSQAKDGGLLVSWQLMECILVWVVSSSLAVEDDFLFLFFVFCVFFFFVLFCFVCFLCIRVLPSL